MTNEEIIADERYHTCGRCKWEGTPFICHQCKWGEDVRKDLWQLKGEPLKTPVTPQNGLRGGSK